MRRRREEPVPRLVHIHAAADTDDLAGLAHASRRGAGADDGIGAIRRTVPAAVLRGAQGFTEGGVGGPDRGGGSPRAGARDRRRGDDARPRVQGEGTVRGDAGRLWIGSARMEPRCARRGGRSERGGDGDGEQDLFPPEEQVPAPGSFLGAVHRPVQGDAGRG